MRGFRSLQISFYFFYRIDFGASSCRFLTFLHKIKQEEKLKHIQTKRLKIPSSTSRLG